MKLFNEKGMDGIRIIAYQDLEIDESLLVLLWRNDSRIRKWMINDKLITKKEHFNFVESLKDSDEKKYFLVKLKNNAIGVFYMQKYDDYFYWGYFINPELINKSYGILLEYLAVEYAFKELNLKFLKCKTKLSNKSVLNMHRFFYFKRLVIEDGYEIMELDSETWNNKKDKILNLVKKIVS